jgi:hypothetical protein
LKRLRAAQRALHGLREKLLNPRAIPLKRLRAALLA